MHVREYYQVGHIYKIVHLILQIVASLNHMPMRNMPDHQNGSLNGFFTVSILYIPKLKVTEVASTVNTRTLLLS